MALQPAPEARKCGAERSDPGRCGPRAQSHLCTTLFRSSPNRNLALGPAPDARTYELERNDPKNALDPTLEIIYATHLEAVARVHTYPYSRFWPQAESHLCKTLSSSNRSPKLALQLGPAARNCGLAKVTQECSVPVPNDHLCKRVCSSRVSRNLAGKPVRDDLCKL